MLLVQPQLGSWHIERCPSATFDPGYLGRKVSRNASWLLPNVWWNAKGSRRNPCGQKRSFRMLRNPCEGKKNTISLLFVVTISIKSVLHSAYSEINTPDLSLEQHDLASNLNHCHQSLAKGSHNFGSAQPAFSWANAMGEQLTSGGPHASAPVGTLRSLNLYWTTYGTSFRHQLAIVSLVKTILSHMDLIWIPYLSEDFS